MKICPSFSNNFSNNFHRSTGMSQKEMSKCIEKNLTGFVSIKIWLGGAGSSFDMTT